MLAIVERYLRESSRMIVRGRRQQVIAAGGQAFELERAIGFVHRALIGGEHHAGDHRARIRHPAGA